MGTLVVGINIVDQPAPNALTGGFTKGGINGRASATGIGTWSATFCFAPVDGAGIIGAVATITVDNNTPMVETGPIRSYGHAYIGWWPLNLRTGTVQTGVGTVEG